MSQNYVYHDQLAKLITEQPSSMIGRAYLENVANLKFKYPNIEHATKLRLYYWNMPTFVVPSSIHRKVIGKIGYMKHVSKKQVNRTHKKSLFDLKFSGAWNDLSENDLETWNDIIGESHHKNTRHKRTIRSHSR